MCLCRHAGKGGASEGLCTLHFLKPGSVPWVGQEVAAGGGGGGVGAGSTGASEVVHGVLWVQVHVLVVC